MLRSSRLALAVVLTVVVLTAAYWLILAAALRSVEASIPEPTPVPSSAALLSERVAALNEVSRSVDRATLERDDRLNAQAVARIERILDRRAVRQDARVEAREAAQVEPPPSDSAPQEGTVPVSPNSPTAPGAVEAYLPEPWRSLADCETGGTFNPSIVSSNGLYHGLFQFLDSTWQAVGGSGSASHASVAEQLMRAKMLQARSGWGQWPVCAAGFS